MQQELCQLLARSTAGFRRLGLLAIATVFVARPVHADQCLLAASGLISATCIAGDLKTDTISKFAGPSKCVGGSTIYVQLQAVTTAGSSQRYDVGYFVSLDGGDAKSGSCFRDYLPPPLNTTPSMLPQRPSPFFDADADQCGDPEQSKTLIRNIGGTAVLSGTAGPPAILAIPCVDLDGAGAPLEADVSICTSWDNQSDSTNCTSVSDAAPGTEAKCSCSEVKISGITYKESCSSDADCDDGNLCTTDSCDSNTLKCVNTAVGAGTACDDNNPCTTSDTCGGSGNLVCAGTPVTCPGNQCRDAGTCDFGTGLCNNPNKDNGTPCEDGEACTLNDACSNGSCQPGAPVNCDTPTPTTTPTATATDTPTATPTETPVPLGGSCVDTSQCIRGLICIGGICGGPLATAPAASNSGLLILIGVLAAIGGFAILRPARLKHFLW